jgi:hypothetical protein
MHLSRNDNDHVAVLHIEFEDDDAETPAEPEDWADLEFVGAEPLQAQARGHWQRLSPRGRRLVTTAGALFGLAISAAPNLAAHTSRRPPDRVDLTIVGGTYVTSASGQGFDLVADLRDTGPSTATILFGAVDQSGLKLSYTADPKRLEPGQQTEFVLSGRYDCATASAPDATTLSVTAYGPQGALKTMDLPLPRNVTPPDSWRGDLAAYCSWQVEATGLQ